MNESTGYDTGLTLVLINFKITSFIYDLKQNKTKFYEKN